MNELLQRNSKACLCTLLCVIYFALPVYRASATETVAHRWSDEDNAKDFKRVPVDKTITGKVNVMNSKITIAHRSQSLALLPLKTVLKEAKVFSPPDARQPQSNRDEQLASTLVENVKKEFRRPSPFASWMGQPFPDEYKEMVAADV